jgi:hypothetical protein
MQISVLACNASVGAVTGLIDAGSPPGLLKFFTGSMPVNTTDADSGTLLATLMFSSTSFGTPALGTGTANAITGETNCPASGTAGYWRAYYAAGAVIAQGTVGTSGADINLNTTSIVAGGTLNATSLTFSQPPA